MTKEELLLNHGEAWEYSHKLEVCPLADAYKAMDELAGYLISRRSYTEEITDIPKTILDEYAKITAIGFFKWYIVKMVGFLEYIKDIRPSVTSNEIEEKIQEFEGKSIETLYLLYLQSQNKTP